MAGASAEPAGPKLLVTVALPEPDPEPIPGALVELVATIPVVVLGYRRLPDQTAPDQARDQFEGEDLAALSALAEPFEAAGAPVETRLVYTRDAEQTITRVANDEGCTAVLVPHAVGGVERLLVPMRGEINLDRVVEFLTDLMDGTAVEVTLFHAAPGEEGVAAGELMLEGARERLADAGVNERRIGVRVVVADARVPALLEAARDHDAVLMGESEPSLATVIFGEVHDRVVEAADRPVFVVRPTERDDPEE